MSAKLNSSVQKILENSHLSQKEKVNLMIEEAVKLTESSMGYFALLTEDKETLIILGWSKNAMEQCAILEKPMVYPLIQTGLWGDAIREKQPVITNDYPNSERITKKGYPDGHVDVKRHANIPVYRNGEIVGVLGVGNKEQDYTDEDMELLSDFMKNVIEIVNPGIDYGVQIY